MAVLGFSDDAADVVSFRKAIFRMILERARERVTDPADIEELKVAEFAEGISFELLDEDQRSRLADAVYEGTESLRLDIAAGKPTEEPVRDGIEEKLDEILALLARFRGGNLKP
jgi:hypothetical protein